MKPRELQQLWHTNNNSTRASTSRQIPREITQDSTIRMSNTPTNSSKSRDLSVRTSRIHLQIEDCSSYRDRLSQDSNISLRTQTSLKQHTANSLSSC